MKKIIFSKEACIGAAIEDWSVREIAKQVGIKLSYNQYKTISDQELDVWENVPEPWLVNAATFKKAFLKYLNNTGGD